MRCFVAFALALSLCVLPACGDKDTGGSGTNTGGGGAQPPANTNAGGTPGAGTPDIGSGGMRATGNVGLDAAQREALARATAKARAFLLTEQDDKGAFGEKAAGMKGNVAFTAMAAAGLVAAPD